MLHVLDSIPSRRYPSARKHPTEKNRLVMLWTLSQTSLTHWVYCVKITARTVNTSTFHFTHFVVAASELRTESRQIIVVCYLNSVLIFFCHLRCPPTYAWQHLSISLFLVVSCDRRDQSTYPFLFHFTWVGARSIFNCVEYDHISHLMSGFISFPTAQR